MSSDGSKKVFVKSSLYMDTVVSLKVVTSRSEAEVEESVARAFEAFYFVERVCSRFNEQSEVMLLSKQIGSPVRVSDILFEAIRFAWEVADFTEGAFDPTVGHTMNAFGFNRHYLTGQKTVAALAPTTPVSYQDVLLDEENRTVLLRKPLLVDLGAVAKGLAVDLATKEMRHFEGFVIDAGGDIFAGGMNQREEPWLIGVRHPVRKEETICSLRLSDAAICTSGSYERVSPVKANTHHLINPKSGMSQTDVLSCSVIAPFAMMADAFSTAAFILGPEKGIGRLESTGLDGIFVTPSLEMKMTKDMKRYLHEHG